MPHFGGHWTDRWRALEGWFLPPECLLCARPVTDPTEPLICPLCRARWRPVPHPRCERCGQPAVLALACRHCHDWPRDFVLARSAVLLDPPVRRLLHQFKYHGWRRLATVMAGAMAPLLAEVGPGDLVPIPSGRRRRRGRGYNQAEELARALAQASGRRLAAGRLRRVREVGSQTRLGAAERRANLAEVFEAAPDDRPVVLVDDVFTTGATLLSAATTCLDAGGSRVAALTFARAEPPLVAASRRLHPPLPREA